MKDIFSELYNKVLGFFRQAEKKEEETAKDVACNRLKFVLMQDRTNLTPELMDRMRKELVELLSKYVEMDKEALELGFEQEGTQMALMLSIPVVRAKDEAEIEAILAQEDAEKANNESDIDDVENADSEISDEAIDSDDVESDEVDNADNADDVDDKSSEDEVSVDESDALDVSDDVSDSDEEKVVVTASASKCSK